MLTYTIRIDWKDAQDFRKKLLSVEPNTSIICWDVHGSDGIHVGILDFVCTRDTYLILKLAYPFKDITGPRTPEQEAIRWLRHKK